MKSKLIRITDRIKKIFLGRKRIKKGTLFPWRTHFAEWGTRFPEGGAWFGEGLFQETGSPLRKQGTFLINKIAASYRNPFSLSLYLSIILFIWRSNGLDWSLCNLFNYSLLASAQLHDEECDNSGQCCSFYGWYSAGSKRIYNRPLPSLSSLMWWNSISMVGISMSFGLVGPNCYI